MGSRVVTWLAYTTVRDVVFALELLPADVVLLLLHAAIRTRGRQAAAARTGLRRRAARWGEVLIGVASGAGDGLLGAELPPAPFGIPKVAGGRFVRVSSQ